MASSSALNVSIRKFDMKKIPKDAVCVFIGRRRTGKSTLVKDLLYHQQDMPLVTAISGTEESNSFFSSMIPKSFIWPNYDAMRIATFVKNQRRLLAHLQKESKAGIQSNIDPRNLLILDDCMYDESWHRDPNIRYLFLNGRHLKVFFLITMQYALGIPPALRTNIDFVFILKEPSITNRKKLFDNYGSAFPSFEFFCQIMDQCTNNFECLVIDNTSLSNKLEDCIFWYKAELNHPPFRIGSPAIWDWDRQNRKGDDDDDSGNNNWDPNSNRKFRGPQIQVRKFPQQ